MHIEKAKLPKDMSYPLQSSILETEFLAHDICLDAHLVQGGSSHLLECFFWPPNPNNNHERIYIRTSATPSVRSHELRLFINDSVIPELIDWIKKILALPPNSTRRREVQHFVRELP